MKTIRYECDNHCGQSTMAGGVDTLPLTWVGLTDSVTRRAVDNTVSWTFCSRRCLVQFLYKAEAGLALGAKVTAHIEGSSIIVETVGS